MQSNSKFHWILCLAVFVLAQPAFAQDQANLKPLPEGTIRYEFVDQPWTQIIESYAEKAGLDLTMIEPPPTGNFKFQGNRDMSFLEALDLLNEQLIPAERILVRKETGLFLFDIRKGIP